MAMKTDTLLMLGGLGLLGFGMYYMMNKQGAQPGAGADARINAAVAASGATNPQQANEVKAAITAAAPALASPDPATARAAEQDLTATYVGMGLTVLPGTIKAIKDIFA